MSTGVRNYGLVQEIEGAGAGPQIEGRYQAPNTRISAAWQLEGNINVIGPIEDAPMPKDTSNVVHMDIGAILHLSASSDSYDSDLAIGSKGRILGRKGLLRLGLKVNVSKEYLYPTTLVSALVFSVVPL
ncbi:hypothetical protein CY35_03G122700 [Sphagnum magellanicum]|nr:hypothetical protein CY35_03G122700 [Sphagnum magellanicum]